MSANVNTTMNGTQPSSCFNPTAERIAKTIAYCLLFVVSLTGNSLIGLIVYKTKTMRKPINFLILNMAMSDLLIPIFLFPGETTKVHVSSWLISGPLGQALCKLAPFLGDLSFTVSIQSLVLIAVDRFGAVVFPLRSPLISRKVCRFFILATWIIAMAILSPYLFFFQLAEYPGMLMCLAFAETSFLANYALALLIVLVYFPLVLIALIYSVILLKLKSQKIPGEQSVNAREQRAKRKRKVLKMSIAIVLVFAICWLPLSTCNLLIYFPPDSTMISSWGFQCFFSISLFLTRSNCAINPCICFIFSGNYRQGLKNLLSCCRAADTTANQVVPA